MAVQTEIIKEDILTKRAIGKSFIRNFSLKERKFVLTPTDLIYYECSEEKQKEKVGETLNLLIVCTLGSILANLFKNNFSEFYLTYSLL